ncbi:MAG: AzlD domain-containing protein [Thermoanaerobacterales bacterium]|nr:AzlD domain-containing protein [Thermoanaerobacterales bacterium]
METKLLVILGMAAVTYIPRMLPLALLARVGLPEGFIRWLRFVPVAVLSALLAPELLLRDGQVALNAANTNLLAAVPCFAAAVLSRNMLLTVAVGLAAAILLETLP